MENKNNGNLNQTFSEFRSIVLNNKINYETWRKYYILFSDAFNSDITDFDFITNAIYLKSAKLLPFTSKKEEQNYFKEKDVLITIIDEYKMGILKNNALKQDTYKILNDQSTNKKII